MQIFETEIKEHSGLKYKIQLRQNQGIWQQRHIWYPAPQTYVETVRADDWIRSTQTPPDDRYYKPRKGGGF